MTFLNHEFPQYVDQLKNIGKLESSGGSTDKTPPTLSVPASSDRTDTATSFQDKRPIALPASRDTKAAFAAGGVIAAIEAKEHRRKASMQEADTLIQLRTATVYRLEELEDTLAMRAASVNDLTRNDDNWLETIPVLARRFAASVFSDESAKELPPSRPGLDCAITIRQGEKLSSCKVYDMSKEPLTSLRQILDEQLGQGFIQPSSAGNSSPVFFVTDKASASRGVDQLRLVVDHLRLVVYYRDLNSKILLDEYPPPLVRTVMERLPRAQIFTKFDVRAGFNNMRIRPGDGPKTAFMTFLGLFEYKVMPFGLATAPSVFQRFINHVLAPFLDIFVFAYLDDIVIFSENENDHERHVTQWLDALEKAQLDLKPARCAWRQKEIFFLGFTAVAGKVIRMSDDKLEAMRESDAPKNVRDVRSFLGLTNLYGAFVPDYSDICSPVTALTGKGVSFEWTPECAHAFTELKKLLRSDVLLAAYDRDKPAYLETDASNAAYAGVISAGQTGVFHLDIRISNRLFIDVCAAVAAETGLKSRNVEKRINAV
jgi:hypothetical protein